MIKYPFEFKEMILTDRALDKLGFSEYWAGSGDYGDRRFGRYTLIVIDEKDDDADGYGSWPAEYCPGRFTSNFKSPRGPIYFLHELYEDIKSEAPDELEAFINKAKTANMFPFLKSYLEFSKNAEG